MKIKYLLITLTLVLSAVLSFAQDFTMSYYTISPEKVEEYAAQDLLKDTAKVFSILENEKAFKYESRLQMADKVLDKIKDFPHYQKIVNNFIQASWTVREDTVSDKIGMINSQVYLDDYAIDSLKWYILDDLTYKMVFSEQVLQFIENMQGMEFLDSKQLHLYVKNLLASSFKICDGKINSQEEDYYAALESFYTKKKKNLIDYFKNTQSEKCKKTKNYGECMEKNCNIRKIYRNVMDSVVSDIEREKKFIERYRSRICSDDLWKRAFGRLDTLYSVYLKDVVDSSLVKINSEEDAPIVLNAKSCGCSHKEELNGEVIGFYPYWYAGDTTKWVDFEGITRLAYYGLQVDKSGILHTSSGKLALAFFEKEENYEFVNEVHRHNVKLDWVVFKNDWNDVKLDKFFDKLSVEIDSLLNTKINSYFQRFVNAFTFYTDEYENRGDGVTFFFKNYPTDEKSTKLFNQFFERLKAKLSDKNESVHVNLMMERSD